MLLSGMGQVHLEIALEKLKRKFGVEVTMRPQDPLPRDDQGAGKSPGQVQEAVGRAGVSTATAGSKSSPCREAAGTSSLTRSSAASFLSNTVRPWRRESSETMKEGAFAAILGRREG